MRRHFSGWTVLLLLAILFVLGLLWVRNQPQKVDDPLAEAQEDLHQRLGFLVEDVPGPDGGLKVKEVKPGSPASFLGLQAGDRVLTVNERSVWHAVQLQELLEERLQLGPAVLLVEREGVFRQVVLGGHAPPGQGGAGAPSKGRSPQPAPASDR